MSISKRITGIAGVICIMAIAMAAPVVAQSDASLALEVRTPEGVHTSAVTVKEGHDVKIAAISKLAKAEVSVLAWRMNENGTVDPASFMILHAENLEQQGEAVFRFHPGAGFTGSTLKIQAFAMTSSRAVFMSNAVTVECVE